MNPNLTQVSKPTQWKAGVSGNPNGRPVGTRQAFSAAFYRDLAEVWAAHGTDAMLHTAKTQPATFLGIASRLIPQQVAVDLQASLPGNLSMEDWTIMREVVEAVRQAMPDASSKPPGAVFEHVLGALRQADAKTVDCPQNT
jgi:Family of unknown function (DUF5681)